MSRYGFFSLIAFATMAVIGSLSIATSAYLEADYRDFTYQVADHTERILVSLPDLSYEHAAYVAELEQVPDPGRSATDVLYVAHNQPGQHWRFGVDAYRHIDPGRRLI